MLKYLKYVDDINAMNNLKSFINDQSQFDIAWLTILAIYVLEKKFSHLEDEWMMVCKKAKLYLNSLGILKVDPILRQINIPLL